MGRTSKIDDYSSKDCMVCVAMPAAGNSNRVQSSPPTVQGAVEARYRLLREYLDLVQMDTCHT
eukprot:44076-Eustigmatos_ZCMA.PRE.1